MQDDAYVGTELELFAHANNWKEYLRRRIAPHLGSTVLEVGAGIGGTTAVLGNGHRGRWVCLEPDPALASKIEERMARGELASGCEVRVGTLDQLDQHERFDTVLYIDVLEHIEDDAMELQRAARRLRQGGRLVVMSPAHQWLYSPFDKAIGHYRRYTRKTLQAAVPPMLSPVVLDYLDAVGLLASAGNRFVTRSSVPGVAQIKLWDRVMIPASRVLDRVIGHSLGKSVLGVWQLP
jgi:ubiquinone/menaquinone biosynthesis C-methylase UbiE